MKIFFYCKSESVLLNCFQPQQEIEEFSVRSSLFSSDVAKLLSLTLQGVRINVDVPAVSAKHKNRSNKVLDFRNTKVPSFIITVVQVSSYQRMYILNVFSKSTIPIVFSNKC